MGCLNNMSDFRESLKEGVSDEAKAYIDSFWDAYDKLYVDMDSLTYEEYKIRNRQMWDFIHKFHEVSGTYVLLTLYGLEDKANKLFGDKIEKLTLPIPPPTRVVNLKNEPYDVYIGRGSKWGCPFTVIKDRPTLAKEIVDSKEEALAKYKEYVLNSPELMESLDELDGKTLGCFCKPEPCHGDVLLELIAQKKLKAYLNKK